MIASITQISKQSLIYIAADIFPASTTLLYSHQMIFLVPLLGYYSRGIIVYLQLWVMFFPDRGGERLEQGIVMVQWSIPFIIYN